MPEEILYKKLSFDVIACCLEVHKTLGRGHSEIVYKDALEYELLKAGIGFNREKCYKIKYKDTILPHQFFADFVIDDKIVFEVKAVERLNDAHVKQTLNYLAASGLRLGILVNFGESSLIQRRVVL